MKYYVLELTNITSDVIEFYKNNLDIAKQQYEELIEMAKPRGLDKSSVEFYCEIHHIIPRCLGGDNNENNLVLLSYKEHILAHMLLYVLNPDKIGLFLSFSFLIDMIPNKDNLITLSISLDYLDEIKMSKSNRMLGDNNPMKNPEIAKKVSEFKKGKEGFFKGKHHSDETKRILSEKTKSLGWIGEKHPMYGRKHSEESLRKMSESHKGKGHPLTEKAKQNLSKIRKKMVQGPDGTIYDSVMSAAKAAGVGRDVISRYINHKPEKGYKFYYNKDGSNNTSS